MTVAATLATAPLIAFHFGELSTVTLVANLLALPAVAPAMWLGMLAAAARPGPRLPGRGAERCSTSLLLAYIAEVASWCARPAWASVEVQPRAGRPGRLLRRARRARRSLGRWLAVAAPARRRRRAVPRRALARRRSPLPLAVAALAWRGGGRRGPPAAPPPAGLRIDGPRRRPGRRDPAAAGGRAGGPGRRRAAAATGSPRAARRRGRAPRRRRRHPRPVRPRRRHRRAARRGAGRPPALRAARPPAAGGGERRPGPSRAGSRPASELRSAGCASTSSGRRAALLAGPHAGEDPNRLALVMVARWRGFSMLLTADAEAESIPIDPGPVDVLKVAHHGSDDAGLGAPARPDPAAAGGDLGRRGQPLRPSDRGDAGDARRARRPHPAHRPRRHDRRSTSAAPRWRSAPELIEPDGCSEWTDRRLNFRSSRPSPLPLCAVVPMRRTR